MPRTWSGFGHCGLLCSKSNYHPALPSCFSTLLPAWGFRYRIYSCKGRTLFFSVLTACGHYAGPAFFPQNFSAYDGAPITRPHFMLRHALLWRISTTVPNPSVRQIHSALKVWMTQQAPNDWWKLTTQSKTVHWQTSYDSKLFKIFWRSSAQLTMQWPAVRCRTARVQLAAVNARWLAPVLLFCGLHRRRLCENQLYVNFNEMIVWRYSGSEGRPFMLNCDYI